MKEKFENRTLTGSIKIKMDDAKGIWYGDKKEIVDAIISIAEEYDNDGYVLTLRQLYYQLVARDIVPNHDKVYSKISSIKDDVVYSGLVDWEIFEDRGRVPSIAYFENDVKDALRRTIDCYGLNRQIGQTRHVEVWTEKDAISSILRKVTDKYTIRLVVNKGYTSSTAIYGAYERFVEEIVAGKKVTILYFGDHDPSGIDMIRDINDRLMFMFTHGERLKDDLWDKIESWWEREEHTYYDISSLQGYEHLPELFEKEDSSEKVMELLEQGQIALWLQENDLFEIVPVGLTMEQIKQYNPPHNPAKITDPRAKGYIKKYGAISWEVDALRPEVMIEIVKNAIEKNIDMESYAGMLQREKSEKNQIIELIDKIK